MTTDERLVYDLIKDASPRITQLEISRSAQWLGSHPVHEAHLPIDHLASTLRKVRQIIRDLRIERGILILSDINGYWIMKDEDEAKEYLARIEKVAKAQAKAWFVTYYAMKKNYNIHSDYFEPPSKFPQQGKFFDT